MELLSSSIFLYIFCKFDNKQNESYLFCYCIFRLLCMMSKELSIHMIPSEARQQDCQQQPNNRKMYSYCVSRKYQVSQWHIFCCHLLTEWNTKFPGIDTIVEAESIYRFQFLPFQVILSGFKFSCTTCLSKFTLELSFQIILCIDKGKKNFSIVDEKFRNGLTWAPLEPQGTDFFSRQI